MSSASREERESPIDPGRHYGGSHTQDQRIPRCAFRCGASAAGHWRADHCGGAVPAELTDPAGASGRVAAVAEHAECPRDGSDGQGRGLVRSRQALPACSA